MVARSVQRVCVVGAGNGGKTAAADLALQGCTVNLYELPEYSKRAFDGIGEDKQLHAEGDVRAARRPPRRRLSAVRVSSRLTPDASAAARARACRCRASPRSTP